MKSAKSAKKKKAGKKEVKKTGGMKKAKETLRKPLVKISGSAHIKKPVIKHVAEVPRTELESPVEIEKSEKIEPQFEVKKTKIRIIGIGGGGGNIVSEIAQKVKKSSFFIANTDFQALHHAPKNVTTFQFGENLTHGLGTGMDPRISEEAAGEDRERIKKLMEGQDLVILVSSLGGGTGSGATSVFAQISKSMGNLTYGIFTLPFAFEGAKKSEIARLALERVRPYVNALTILPNERVFEVVPKTTPFSKTLSHINAMLSDSLEGLIETIYDTGIINIDFADLHAILTGNGKMAFLNSMSFKKGDEVNLEAFEQVFSSPLYPYTIDRARGLLLNVVAQKDLKLLEVNKILTSVSGRIHKDAKIIFGVSQEGAAPDAVKVTVLATGCVYGELADMAPKDVQAQENAKPEVSQSAKNAPEPKKTEQKKEPVKQREIPQKKKPIAHRKAKESKPKEVKSKEPKPRESKMNEEFAKEQAITIKTNIKKSLDEVIDGTPVAVKDDRREIRQNPIVLIPNAPAEPKDVYQTEQSIMAQFEVPIRKNAIQVKKEVEMEEREMLEKEKAWEIPAFLRKKQKG